MTGYSSKKAMAREAEVIPTGTIPDPAFAKAVQMMSDKGYEESTHEKQAEFAAKRNQQTFYHPVSKEVIEKLIIEALQELNLKVEALKARVQQLEMYQKDDGK